MIIMTELKDIATQIRRDIVRMVHACQSGHPGGSLGCTDFFTALYFDIMKHSPDFHMDGKGEDLFSCRTGIYLRYSMPPLPVPAIFLWKS